MGCLHAHKRGRPCCDVLSSRRPQAHHSNGAAGRALTPPTATPRQANQTPHSPRSGNPSYSLVLSVIIWVGCQTVAGPVALSMRPAVNPMARRSGVERVHSRPAWGGYCLPAGTRLTRRPPLRMPKQPQGCLHCTRAWRTVSFSHRPFRPISGMSSAVKRRAMQPVSSSMFLRWLLNPFIGGLMALPVDLQQSLFFHNSLLPIRLHCIMLAGLLLF